MVRGSHSLRFTTPLKKTPDMSSRVYHMTLERAHLTGAIRADTSSPLSSETLPEEQDNPVILVALQVNTGHIYALMG